MPLDLALARLVLRTEYPAHFEEHGSVSRTDSDVLYLDDLQVGQRFVSGTHAIDADQIKAFAREFDPQPFHLDEVAARETFFGGPAASGWHVAAVTIKLLVTGAPLSRAASWAPVATSRGRTRQDPATCFR
jgi:acyl dehydratase